jgi:maltooligosyltrehalose trehalohydrolase
MKIQDDETRDAARAGGGVSAAKATADHRTVTRSDDAPELRLGALPDARGTTFRLWSTRATKASVVLFDPRGSAQAGRGVSEAAREVPLTGRGDGVFEARVEGVGPGALYKFRIDGDVFPDPYARFFPMGVHGPAEVIDCRRLVGSGADHPRPSVPQALDDTVFYELHVGTFTAEGTYRAAAAKLDALATLGVTTIEIMPVAAFPGARGWGYDGVGLFAPYAPYGRPEELRAFVDEAHRRGLSVVLDVVLNHLGPDGNYLSSYSPEYFDTSKDTPWGPPPNYAHPRVRALAVECARQWLEDYGFDGLRLDAVHAIVDETESHIVRDVAALAHRLSPRRIVVAEDERNEPKLVTEIGVDGIWADDFHHQVRVLLTGEQDGYYGAYARNVAALAETIERGWWFEGAEWLLSKKPRGAPARHLPASAFVYCIQNHDQIGNRALGDRLNHAIDRDRFMAASMLLLFLPMTPLLFMGQEWAASSPFQFFSDHAPPLGEQVSSGRREEFKHFAAFREPAAQGAIPDPQAERTFLASKLDWDERERPGHAEVLSLYTRMLTLRRDDPVLRASRREGLRAVAAGDVLWVRRAHDGGVRVLAVNFGEDAPLTPPPELGLGLVDHAALDVMVRSRPGEGLPRHSAVLLRDGVGNGAGEGFGGGAQRTAVAR